LPNAVRRVLAGFASRRAASDPSRLPESSPVPGVLTLFRTLPGRLFVLTSGLLLILSAVQYAAPLPVLVDLFRRVVGVAWLIGLAWIVALTVSRNRRAFLWRVRRRLILSYIFLGFVPLVLVLAFVLVGGLLLYMTVAQYVFQEGLADLSHDVRQIAETTAIELSRSSADPVSILERKYDKYSSQYPALSLAVIPAAGTSAGAGPRPPVHSGPWRHVAPPVDGPAWLTDDGFSGTLVIPNGPSASPMLLLRAAIPTRGNSRFVVADLPIDAQVAARLAERTGITIGDVYTSRCGVTMRAGPAPRSLWSLFRETVSFLDCTSWIDGGTGTLSVTLEAPLSTLSAHLASVRSAEIAAGVGGSWWRVFLQLLLVLGGLFLVIQGSAVVMGAVLARSITSAVHELFIGTERIQQGDFAYRIGITSRDQLGDLAQSFNRMSASIEHLLHVQREKQRMDDELRIAREIQKSLLPVQPPHVAGVDIADLCEPAREVGGDYYDFFEVGPRLLGVLIADVSGKGTSAALYMAELKGLMLALSHNEPSPRQLLVDVNRRLAEHFDNRSFITMTYAVIDLDRRTLTVARAGHTPLIIVSGGRSTIVTPDGMVLGLRLPGARLRFDELLAEHHQSIGVGDVIVMYTDGITEAMDAAGELFGQEALAAVIERHADGSAAGIRECVVREVAAFVGDAEPHDDMTMIVIKMTDDAA
jgi:sigma-B regulation protein RsbU (phosphoserine phosphatase)